MKPPGRAWEGALAGTEYIGEPRMEPSVPAERADGERGRGGVLGGEDDRRPDRVRGARQGRTEQVGEGPGREEPGDGLEGCRQLVERQDDPTEHETGEEEAVRD